MGRIPTTSSLFLSFLIILLHTNNILIAYSQLAQLYVYDTNGDFVQPGVDYYIQPLSAGGTIGLSSAPNGTCPLDPVLQTDKNALPVRFSPVNPPEANSSITTNIDLNIEFSASTICVTSTVWKIQPSTNGTTTTYFVTTGGVKGNPGRATLNNRFTLEQDSDNRYYIYFCPSVCNSEHLECSRPVCGNIGLIPENGRKRLGITSRPLHVKFVRTGKSIHN